MTPMPAWCRLSIRKRRSSALPKRELGAKKSGALVAPGFVERVFHQGQEFDVGIAELDEIRHQPNGQLAVAVEAAVRMAHPAAQVHLVHAHRRRKPVPGLAAAGSCLHPRAVVPFVRRIGCHATGGGRTAFEGARAGVALQLHRPAATQTQLEAIQCACRQFRHEQFPDAGAAQRGHRIDATVPAIEAAHHGNAFGIRRPDPEADAGNAVANLRHGTECAPSLAQTPGIEQEQVVGRRLRRKGVGIVLLHAVDIEAPRPGRRRRALPLEQVGPLAPRQRRPPAIDQFHRDRFCVRTEHAQPPAGAFGMKAEDGKGVMFARFEQCGADGGGHGYILRSVFAIVLIVAAMENSPCNQFPDNAASDPSRGSAARRQRREKQ
jgi:hypothetical protein